jgi:hypothetical protein
VRFSPEGFPELFAAAIEPSKHKALIGLLVRKVQDLHSDFPGLEVVDLGSEIKVAIPANLRTTHESHFIAVLEEFARYFNTPRAVPPWEQANALARYYITTKGVDLARKNRHSR